MIYLDHNATTPIAPEVRKTMMRYIESEFGNPSSNYPLGKRAKDAVEEARSHVAAFVGGQPSEIIFTSGGTESNNHVIKGIAEHYSGKKDHMITTKIEHPAVLEPMLHLAVAYGWEITFINVDRDGRIDPGDVKKAITSRTALVSVMHANNETGVIQPVEAVGEIARNAGVLFHTDAAQSAGKIDVNVHDIRADFLSLAGHKLYAPKGVGALYIREGVEIPSFIHGAGQEHGLRPGTENVLLDAAFGEACRVAAKEKDHFREVMLKAGECLLAVLKNGLPELKLFGHPNLRLPNTLFVSFPGVPGADVLAGAPEIFASTGAACHDDTVRLSHVLAAMGVEEGEGKGAVRLTTGRSSQTEDMKTAGKALLSSYFRIVQ